MLQNNYVSHVTISNGMKLLQYVCERFLVCLVLYGYRNFILPFFFKLHCGAILNTSMMLDWSHSIGGGFVMDDCNKFICSICD